jgi:hypothetical protein
MSEEASSQLSKIVVWRRLILVLSAALVLAAWGITAIDYAVNGGGEYNGGFFAPFLAAAVILTIAAVWLVVLAWRERSRPLSAGIVSILAALSILWLAIAINLRG